MSHELSITVERDGKHFIESSVEPGKVLEGPFGTQEEANKRAQQRSNEFGMKQRIRNADMIRDLPASKIMELLILSGHNPQDLADEFVRDQKSDPSDSSEDIMRRIYAVRSAPQAGRQELEKKLDAIEQAP